MLNFTAIVEEGEPHPNSEIDSWKWFSVGEARANIRDKSLAQAFLNGFFDGFYNF
jgi:NADH pyrophosphatase NudC (nudix superfamily)